jgi:hypothetical protein
MFISLQVQRRTASTAPRIRRRPMKCYFLYIIIYNVLIYCIILYVIFISLQVQKAHGLDGTTDPSEANELYLFIYYSV